MRDHFYNSGLNNRQKTVLFWLSLVLLAVAGFGVIWYSTPNGPGLINDSVIYVMGAENILAGNGYSRTTGSGEPVPISVNPPAFSFIIGQISRSGMDLVNSAWLLNILAFCACILLVGAILKQAGVSPLFSFFGALLFAATEPVLRSYTFALTEPIFTTFFLAALLGTVTYARSPLSKNARWLLLGCGIFAGLAYLTRYIGLSVIAAGAVAALVFAPTWKRKIVDLLIFLAGALPGVLAWSVRNYNLTGNPTNRELGLHLIPADKLAEGVANFWEWLLPDRFNLFGRYHSLLTPILYVLFGAAVLITAAVVFGVLLNKSKTLRANTSAAPVIAVQALGYLCTLLFSMNFMDASTAMENRILFPFYTCLDMLIVMGLAWLWNRVGRASKIISAALALLLLVNFAYDTRRAVIDMNFDGQGFSDHYWRNSLTVEAVKKLPPIRLYSNRDLALKILTGRPSFTLLAPIDPLTRQKRDNYDTILAGIRNEILNGEAVLVVFGARDAVIDPVEGPWFKDLIQGVPEFKKFEDGSIYGSPQQK